MNTNVTALFPNVGGFITSFMRRNHVAEISLPPVMLTPKRVPYGPFVFQVQTTLGAGYEIEASRDLKNWTTLTREVSQRESVEYVDADASKFSYRFYRARTGHLLSTNAIGYASVPLPPGYSLIANPFKATNNSVAALFPGMPEGTCSIQFRCFRNRVGWIRI